MRQSLDERAGEWAMEASRQNDLMRQSAYHAGQQQTEGSKVVEEEKIVKMKEEIEEKRRQIEEKQVMLAQRGKTNVHAQYPASQILKSQSEIDDFKKYWGYESNSLKDRNNSQSNAGKMVPPSPPKLSEYTSGQNVFESFMSNKSIFHDNVRTGTTNRYPITDYKNEPESRITNFDSSSYRIPNGIPPGEDTSDVSTAALWNSLRSDTNLSSYIQ